MTKKPAVSEQNVVALHDFSVLEEYIRIFLHEHDVQPITTEGLRRRLKAFTAWLRTQNPERISRDTILAYKRYLRDEKYTAHSQADLLSAVRTFCNWLEATRRYFNVAKGIRGARRGHKPARDVLTAGQAWMLLNSIDRSTLVGARDHALICMLLYGGCRSIEIARADVEDIRNQGDAVVCWIFGKNRASKDEFIVLKPSVLRPIQEYLTMRPNLKGTDALFGATSDSCRHQRMSTRSIRRIVKKRLRAVALNSPRLSCHSMRGSAITFALLGGASLQEVQSYARHADIKTTVGYSANIMRSQGIPEAQLENYLDAHKPTEEK
jgi:site-specific recombinase XerD